MAMEAAKRQVQDLVRKIDDLNRKIAEHWSTARQHITAGDLDKALAALNGYFRRKINPSSPGS